VKQQIGAAEIAMAMVVLLFMAGVVVWIYLESMQ
jgi:hypothetical protein